MIVPDLLEPPNNRSIESPKEPPTFESGGLSEGDLTPALATFVSTGLSLGVTISLS